MRQHTVLENYERELETLKRALKVDEDRQRDLQAGLEDNDRQLKEAEETITKVSAQCQAFAAPVCYA